VLVVVVVTGRVLVVVVVGRVVVVVGRVVVVVARLVVVVVPGRVVVVVVVVVEPPAQVTPFSANEAGVEPAELPVPMKPGVTLAPEASAPFQASFFTVTLAEPVDQTPLQPWLTVWPLGNVKASVQVLSASPVFLLVIPPWNPPCQELTTA
jgi:hypothetical protein